MVFLPLPVETLGGWHHQTVSLVKRLGFALARHSGQEESEAVRHFSQRMAILLLNWVPNFPSQEIDGLNESTNCILCCYLEIFVILLCCLKVYLWR